MAKIRASNGLDSFIRDLTSLDVSEMTTQMINAAEPIMIENVRKYANKHRNTGVMADSIRSTGVKERNGGRYLVVRPTGIDDKGVRNMEKMAYLEYGTATQPATPVITPAVKASEVKIEQVWNETLGRYMEKHTWKK